MPETRRETFELAQSPAEAGKGTSGHCPWELETGHSPFDSPDPGRTEAAEPLEIPRSIDRYEIRGLLGRGGFGTVFLAWDPRLERLVALKVPRHGSPWSEGTLTEFLSEARMAARIRDPRIVTFYDAGQCASHGVFLVMEYIPGRSLADRLKTEEISVSEACRLMAEAAEAVHAAHRAGIFHRDLKPGNILLTERGEVRISDFGLAVHESRQAALRGQVSGTLTYMSPEQLRGESHLIDGRSDVWSLGVILYRILTHRPPFPGLSREELLEEIDHRAPKPLGQIRDDVDPRLDELCRQCLARDVSARVPTAREMARRLRELQGVLPSGATRWKFTVRVLIAVALAVVVLIGAAVLWHRRDASLPPVPVAPTPDVVISPREPLRAGNPRAARNLMEHFREPWAFNILNELNRYTVSEDGRECTIFTDGFALFALDEVDLPDYDLVVSGHGHFETGFLGLVWGLHEDQNDPVGPYSCLVLQVSPDPRRGQARHYLQQVVFTGSHPHNRSFVQSYTLLSRSQSVTLPTPRPRGRSMEAQFSVRVSVREGRPIAARVEGDTWQFDALPDDIDWTRYTRGHVGLWVANGLFVVNNASLVPSFSD